MTLHDIRERISKISKLGDIRAIAKEIKKDHELAMQLWTSDHYFSKLLSILMLDVKLLDSTTIDNMIADIEKQPYHERLQLADWLMANQLTKSKKTTLLIQSWQNAASPIKRRLFWYHQARLRWVGQVPPANSDELLSSIEQNIESEQPEVQWAMNFTAAWIGVFEHKFRQRCASIGERTELYKDEMVSKGCTPSYLPAFIEIEAKKRNLA